MINKEERVAKKMLKGMSCIQLACAIVSATNDCEEVNPAGAGKAYIKELASRLSLTPMEALQLSVFVDQASDHRINYGDLAKHFDVRPLHIVVESKTLQSLAEKQVIIKRTNNEGDVSFRVHPRLIANLLEDKLPEQTPTTNLLPYELMDALFDKLKMFAHGELDEEALSFGLHTLLDDNPQLELCKKINSMDLSNANLTLLLVLAMHHINNNDFNICTTDIDDYFSSFLLRAHAVALVNGTHELMQDTTLHPALVEYACGPDGMADTKYWRLNDYCLKEVFAELKISGAKKISSNSDLKKHETIEAKELFYPENTRKQIDTLQNLLSGDKMSRILSRLSERKLRKGFNCLFFGTAGTGKTESVLQLARKSGRDIMVVDCSQIRDKFVGETEKNIKAIFDDYREAAKDNEMAPILLFNEADALFNKRKEGAERSVDKMENAMQNIILQEMESLEGILIATTNLTGSLDPAFERRFLYKVEFEKPTAKERMQIWKSQIPELSDEEASQLAKRYDSFAGGQIENISRKYLVQSILEDKDSVSLKDIEEYCNNEMINKNRTNRIGFAF